MRQRLVCEACMSRSDVHIVIFYKDNLNISDYLINILDFSGSFHISQKAEATVLLTYLFMLRTNVNGRIEIYLARVFIAYATNRRNHLTSNYQSHTWKYQYEYANKMIRGSKDCLVCALANLLL